MYAGVLACITLAGSNLRPSPCGEIYRHPSIGTIATQFDNRSPLPVLADIEKPVTSLDAFLHGLNSRASAVAGTSTMPPHLHPRSRMTSSIFVTTLLASFAVVTLPHILPCPAPRVAYTEGEICPDGKRRRRKRCAPEVATDGLVKEGKPCATTAATLGGEDLEEIVGTREKRECPIPKPGGTVGKILALTGIGSNTDGTGGRRSSP